MITPQPSRERAYQKYAWVILFVLGILLVVNILIVAAFEDRATEFKENTGIALDDFAATYPGVATAYVLNQRLLYVSFASLALFALVVTYFGCRRGHRWAWFAMWLFPASLALTALLFLPSRRPEIGTFYAGFAVVAIIGLLLPIRNFFPKPS